MLKKAKFFNIIILFFLTCTAFAEQVITEGNYIYTGNISENEACSLAKERAKLKALEKVSGQRISTEEIEMCSEVDGKTSCERNRFFLSSFDSEITKLKELKKDRSISIVFIKFLFSVLPSCSPQNYLHKTTFVLISITS